MRVVLASDRESPMPAFMHLWRAVMDDLQSLESVERVSRAVFTAMWQAYDGFQDRMWELALEIVEGDPELRERLLPDLASWKSKGPENVGSSGKPGKEEE